MWRVDADLGFPLGPEIKRPTRPALHMCLAKAQGPLLINVLHGRACYVRLYRTKPIARDDKYMLILKKAAWISVILLWCG